MSEDESTSQAKRPRLEGEPAKYPFVDYDGWLEGSCSSGSIFVELDPSLVCPTAAVSGSVRPLAVWFQLSADLSPACLSAQNSVVAHSPFRCECGEPPPTLLYISRDQLDEYIQFRKSMPSKLFHPFFNSPLYREAQLADAISGGVRRDPSRYASVWPSSVLGRPAVLTGAALAVLDSHTESSVYRHPGQWEQTNRSIFIASLLEGVEAVGEGGDMLVRMQGLIVSVWLGGLLFRLSQLFFKLTVVRPHFSPCWDDSFFLCAAGKRAGTKHTKRTLSLLKRLLVEPRSGDRWGYSAPPACFGEPRFVEWVKLVNSQLIGGHNKKPISTYPSIEKCASILRFKKYLFPNRPANRVGFYFGSFSPVHENHLAVARFAVDQLGFAKVVFVPNQDGNDAKPDMPLLSHRVGMIRARLDEEDTNAFQVLTPPGKTHRWEAKAELAEAVCGDFFMESQDSGQPVILLGQDSWNKAVLGSSRDKVTRHFIGIAKLVKTEVFVFPRTAGADEFVANPPKPIRELVTIVQGYQDPIVGLSSSAVREGLLSGSHQGLHPAVQAYIQQHQLYS